MPPPWIRAWYEIFFPFSFSFTIENEKNEPPPLPPLPPLPPPPLSSIFFGGAGSSSASPLEIWDVMPPYLKTFFEQKTEI